MQQKQDGEPIEQNIGETGIVLNPQTVIENSEKGASNLEVVNFRGSSSGVLHDHGFDKHDVRSGKINVRDEFVEQHFPEYQVEPNDHAAIWLLHFRKDEFIDAQEEVFSDVEDTNEARWEHISSRRKSAPIPPEFQRELRP